MGPPASMLRVEATFAGAATDSLEIDPDAAPYVANVEVWVGQGWRSAPQKQDGAWAAACLPSGCRVRYSFALGDAARTLDDMGTAFAAGAVVVAPPSTWLLRPSVTGPGGHFRFHVTTEPGVRFATGIRASEDGAADTFEAGLADLASASLAVFGPFARTSVQSGASRVEIAVSPTGLSMSADDARVWTERAVSGIAGYLGRFPAPTALVVIAAGNDAVTRGLTLGDGGPSVVVRTARGLTAQAARDDWVLTHELLHVVLPTFGRRHAWLEEGIATYVEPIVRARTGLVTPERFWRDLVDGLPQGRPETGDEGLERTHTWGRTYWGGALFCFVADVRIREASRGQRSFDDVLRGVAATGADVTSRWEVAQFLEVGDRATGTRVLTDLYKEMALAPGDVDLGALWQRLGVRPNGGGVVFDESAPLAQIRHAVTIAPVGD